MNATYNIAAFNSHSRVFTPANVHIRFIVHPESRTFHATLFNGTDRQTIAVQRGFFCAVTDTSLDITLGSVDVTPFIAAALGFLIPIRTKVSAS
jgi:hypothetical protein